MGTTSAYLDKVIPKYLCTWSRVAHRDASQLMVVLPHIVVLTLTLELILFR